MFYIESSSGSVWSFEVAAVYNLKPNLIDKPLQIFFEAAYL